jgi:hypothetical protein
MGILAGQQQKKQTERDELLKLLQLIGKVPAPMLQELSGGRYPVGMFREQPEQLSPSDLKTIDWLTGLGELTPEQRRQARYNIKPKERTQSPFDEAAMKTIQTRLDNIYNPQLPRATRLEEAEALISDFPHYQAFVTDAYLENLQDEEAEDLLGKAMREAEEITTQVLEHKPDRENPDDMWVLASYLFDKAPSLKTEDVDRLIEMGHRTAEGALQKIQSSESDSGWAWLEPRSNTIKVDKKGKPYAAPPPSSQVTVNVGQGKQMPAGTVGDISSLYEVYSLTNLAIGAAIDPATGKYDPTLTGKEALWHFLREKLPGLEANERYVLLKDYLNDSAELLLRARSGAQINEQEYKRLRKLLSEVKPTQKDSVFVAKLQRFHNALRTMIKTKQTTFHAAGYQVPVPPGVPNYITGEGVEEAAEFPLTFRRTGEVPAPTLRFDSQGNRIE